MSGNGIPAIGSSDPMSNLVCLGAGLGFRRYESFARMAEVATGRTSVQPDCAVW